MAKRYLIKLSGEVLGGESSSGISWEVADSLGKRLSDIIKTSKVELGFVIGGGNVIRGAAGHVHGFNRLYGDQMGMMATVINCLALAERLKFYNIPVTIQSGVKIEGVAGLFNRDEVDNTFSKGGCVVFGGGTGNPFFSTDTTAALRALQIGADYLFKATKVDGIYDKDPAKHADAVKFDTLTYDKIITMNLQVMDLTAMQLLKENNMKLQVFDMMSAGNLEKACNEEVVGTIVS